MEIYLLRHGIAENAQPGMKDSDRALTSEGRDKLKRVLKRARTAGVEPGVILSSPYRRALETAKIAAETFGYTGKVVETAALVPNASPHDVWNEIRSRKDEAALFLASHEPLMSSTLAHLLASPALQVDMKKDTLVRLDSDRLTAEPHCVLKWMLTPGVCLE